MKLEIIIVISYLLGSIPFGFLLTKFFLKKDIREIGSGNIGATNALRTGNKFIGYTTLILDVFKAVIPIILAMKLKANIQMAKDKKIVFISSQMGSIDDNYSGRFYFYRSSKSALNSAAKSLSIDWKKDGISIFILHPGWVKTDMGGSNAKLEISDSISQMIKVIDNMTLSNSGSFVNYAGEKLEW